MEMLKSYLAPSDGSNDICTLETIDKLIDRLNTSTRLDDRRDAMRGIKALSKAYELHLRRSAICLLYVMLKNSIKMTQEAILGCPMGISKIVDTLNDRIEAVRNDVIAVYILLQGLLLLIELSKSHSNIQKIVAFENTYEFIFQIILKEGYSDGGVIVEDSLELLKHLLFKNTQNQILFQEGGFIRRIIPFFEFNEVENIENLGWSTQKMINVGAMLDIIRCLVAPCNKLQAIRACQKEMKSCGLLPVVCGLILDNCVPSEVLTAIIYAAAEMVRGSEESQQFLASYEAPSDPPQPAIQVLLISMVTESQPFDVRLAVLYCFQCLMAGNPKGKADVIGSIRPKSDTAVGHLLCTGLFSNDAASTWFASIALAHSIMDSNQLKEELLKVQLAPSVGGEQVTLLQQCFNLLGQGIKLQARVGLLQLLCIWLAHCPTAVQSFMNRSASNNSKVQSSETDITCGTNLSLLIAETATVDNDESESTVRGLVALLIGICLCYGHEEDRPKLLKIVDKRIGMDVMLDRLGQIPRCEPFSQAMKYPQPRADNMADLIFDYEFTKLFRTLEYEVSKVLNSFDQKEAVEEPDIKSDPNGQVVVISEKEALEDSLSKLMEELRLSREHNEKLADANTSFYNKEMLLKNKIKYLEDQMLKKDEENLATQKKYDDLLILWSDQEVKIDKLQAALKKLGHTLPDTSDEDEGKPNQEANATSNDIPVPNLSNTNEFAQPQPQTALPPVSHPAQYPVMNYAIPNAVPYSTQQEPVIYPTYQYSQPQLLPQQQIPQEQAWPDQSMSAYYYQQPQMMPNPPNTEQGQATAQNILIPQAQVNTNDSTVPSAQVSYQQSMPMPTEVPQSIPSSNGLSDSNGLHLPSSIAPAMPDVAVSGGVAQSAALFAPPPLQSEVQKSSTVSPALSQRSRTTGNRVFYDFNAPA